MLNAESSTAWMRRAEDVLKGCGAIFDVNLYYSVTIKIINSGFS